MEELNNFLRLITTDLPCLEQTQAYIYNVFRQLKKPNFSQESLTLIFAEAKIKGNFNLYQELADWIFFIKSLYPKHLNNASPEYYLALAQTSYYRCYLILNKEWKLYEELADKLPILTEKINNNLFSFKHFT